MLDRPYCVPGRHSMHMSVAFLLPKARAGPKGGARKGDAEQLQALAVVNTNLDIRRDGSHSEKAAPPQDNQPHQSAKKGKKRGPTKNHGKKSLRDQRAGSQDQGPCLKG